MCFKGYDTRDYRKQQSRRRIIKSFLLLLIITCFLIAGCEETEDTPSPTPTQPPTATAEISPPPTDIPVPTAEPTPSITPTTSSMELLKVHFIDVGQGDAILVDLGETEVLIDGGPKSSDLLDQLQSYVDGSIEVIVATHPHADHIGGLISVLEAYEVKEVWHNGDTSTSKTYQQFMEAVEAEEAVVNVARLHDVISLGSLEFYVHHPAELNGSTNNNSVVLHLAYGETDFLFTGDAEHEAEGQMMMLSSVQIPEVEVLKIGHHASRTASSPDFLQITSPEVAIYMAKEDNSYGHPHEETITSLNGINAQIYGTDVLGTIVVQTDGTGYEIMTE